MAPLIEHDRFVEAVELSLCLRQGGVGIDACDLGARRDASVGDSAPGGRLAAGALFDIEIRPEWGDEDQQVVLEVVQANAENLGALVGERPDVDVLAITRHLNQLRGNRVEFLVIVGEVDLHDAAALAEAIEVLLETEDVDLAFLLVPVTANALEYRRTVIERMSHHADLGVFQGDDLLLEVGVRRRHRQGLLSRG